MMMKADLWLDFDCCRGYAPAGAPKGFPIALWKPSAPQLLGLSVTSFTRFLDKHAEPVCRSAQLNREKGVERVEDPSRVQGSALLESRGKASGGV